MFWFWLYKLFGLFREPYLEETIFAIKVTLRNYHVIYKLAEVTLPNYSTVELTFDDDWIADSDTSLRVCLKVKC